MADLIDRTKAITSVYTMYERWDTGKTEDLRDLIAEALRVLPSVQPEPKWIPCTEMFPDKCQVVIVSINDGAIYTTVDYWTGDKFDGFDGDAVAWMPLPEPYKGEQE